MAFVAKKLDLLGEYFQRLGYPETTSSGNSQLLPSQQVLERYHDQN
jgi:hypothetical protein